MDKTEFFQDLEEIVLDPLFIGKGEQDLDEEIANNNWSISISNELAKEVAVEDFLSFFDKVISNRRKQIQNSHTRHGMLFYVWFDWQAAQLKFNLISDFHIHLPFDCKIKIFDKLEAIIKEFLNFPYHDGFPYEEVTDEDEGFEEDISSEPLNIFLLNINR